MKKRIVCTLLALMLFVCTAAACFADDPDEIAGTVEMPHAGLRFIPPEAFRNTAGQIITDGAHELLPGIYYAYWVYFASTMDELMAFAMDPAASTADIKAETIFHAFSIAEGKTFDDMNSLTGGHLSPEFAHEIGKVGDTSFYLYLENPNLDFVGSLDPVYAEEFTRLAGMTDQLIGAFECFEPVDKYAGLIGTKVSFTATDLDGNAVSSDDLFAEHEITMVNIWATWCGPCIREMSELQQIHLRLQDRDCGIVGLLADKDFDAARQIVSENGVTYPIIAAPDNYTDIFPLEAYPTSFFVGRDGTILAAPLVGAYVEEYEPRMESLLQGQQ